MPQALTHRVAVLLGGALGTALRVAVVVAVPVGVSGFPWPTFVVNLTGAALLGYAVIRLRARPDPTLATLVGTGVLGAYTTFSTFAVEVVQLLPVAAGTALAYGLGSVLFGVLAALGGVRLAARRAVVPR